MDTRGPYKISLNKCVFRENRHRKGYTFYGRNINYIDMVPWYRMTFWNWREPCWRLCTALRSAPFCTASRSAPFLLSRGERHFVLNQGVRHFVLPQERRHFVLPRGERHFVVLFLSEMTALVSWNCSFTLYATAWFKPVSPLCAPYLNKSLFLTPKSVLRSFTPLIL